MLQLLYASVVGAAVMLFVILGALAVLYVAQIVFDKYSK